MKKIFLLFITFLKIGAFTFGGGFAMIPLIEREIVEKRKWVSQDSMINIISISQSFPGAVAINSSIIIGQRIGGYPGAVAATLGVTLPSLIIIIAVAKIFSYIWEIEAIKAAFRGINSAVIALLISVSIRIGKASLKDKITPFITIVALILLFWIKIHPIYIVLFGIASGIAYYFFKIKKSGKN